MSPESSAPAEGAEDLQVDSHVRSAIHKVQEEFAWIPQIAIASHMTFVRAHAVYRAALSKQYESLNLSVSRFNLLWQLYRTHGRRMAVSDLAAYQGVTIPSVLRLSQALESEGWVCIVRDSTDRRVKIVELTETAQRKLASILPEAFEVWDGLWAALSKEERRVLVGLLGKLRSGLLHQYIGEENLAAFRSEELRRTGRIPGRDETNPDVPPDGLTPGSANAV